MNDMPHAAEEAVRHNILEYAELMLFLLVAMTYINAMKERNVFDSFRTWLVNRGYDFRQLFWTTRMLAFFNSIVGNLVTALLMYAVVIPVEGSNLRFISPGCVKILEAANASSAFSPFGV